MNRQLRLALIRSGIDTFTRLALRTGIERTRLSRIANGVLRPRQAEQQQIAAVLREDIESLFPNETSSGKHATASSPGGVLDDLQ